MKNVKTMTTLALLASIAVSGLAQAGSIQDSALSSLIYEDSSDMFAAVKHQAGNSNEVDIRSYGDDFNQDAVWSTEYQEYVNTNDFKQSDLDNASLVNRYINSNPTAAGTKSGEVFIYNEMAGEYHLQ